MQSISDSAPQLLNSLSSNNLIPRSDGGGFLLLFPPPLEFFSYRQMALTGKTIKKEVKRKI